MAIITQTIPIRTIMPPTTLIRAIITLTIPIRAIMIPTTLIRAIITLTIPIRAIIITGENEMIVMRKDDVKTPKIISIIPVLIIFVFIGADIFGIIGTISNKVSYDKAMERAVEVNAVCEEIYNSAYTQNGMSVKYATVSFEYKGKTEKIDHMAISSDKSVGDTLTILIDPETDNVLLGFDTAGFSDLL